MNYRAIILVGALLSVGVVGCDPYEDEKGGAPEIMSVVLTNSLTPAEGTQNGTAWTVEGAEVDPEEEPLQTTLFVITNKLLDPASIQTSTTDCTPANGWLTVDGPASDCDGTPATWYTCYSPASVSAAEGASIVIFQSCEDPNEVGWLESVLEPGATYHFTGNVKDKGGADLPIDITVTAGTEAAPAAALQR